MQTPHDCSVNQCVAATTTTVADPKDPPPPLGPCDAVSCTGTMPTHMDSDALCPVTDSCSNGKCSCKDCPDGSIAGLPGGTCKLPGGTTASSTTGGNTAGKAVDGSASTEWNSGVFTPVTGGTATLDVVPGKEISARSISINVDATKPAGTSSQIKCTVTVYDGAGNSMVLPTKTQIVPNGGDVFDIGLPAPMKVAHLSITLQSTESALAIFEVGYRTCP
jgi:hypothetical protein